MARSITRQPAGSGLAPIGWIIGWIIGILLSLCLGFGSFVLWLVLMYRACQGHEWEVPFAGPRAGQ